MTKILGITIFCTLLTARAGLTNGLVAYYPFNGNPNDETGNDYNAVVFGARLAPDRFGDADKAYTLGGSDAYLELPTLPFGSEFTISCWFRFDAFEGRQWQRVFDWGNGMGVDNVILCQVRNTSRIGFEIDNKSGENTRIESVSNVVTGQFHQATCILTADSDMLLYLDGKLIAQGQTTNYYQGNRTSNYIGRSNWSSDSLLSGAVDDIRLYSRALASDEVEQLYRFESRRASLLIEPAAVRLRWQAESNITYQVQWSPDTLNWSNLAVIVGTGAETNLIDWTHSSRKFYRLIIGF